MTRFCAAALVLVFACSFAQANLISNPSFEDAPVVQSAGDVRDITDGVDSTGVWYSRKQGDIDLNIIRVDSLAGMDGSDGTYFITHNTSSSLKGAAGQVIDVSGIDVSGELTFSFDYWSTLDGANHQVVLFGNTGSNIGASLGITNAEPGGSWVELINLISSNVNNSTWGVTNYTKDSPNGEWTTVTATVTPGVDYDLLYVGVWVNDINPATLGFDNFNLTPEPASLSALALGGLALLRRRRN